MLSACRFGYRRFAVACHKRTDLMDVSAGDSMFQRSPDFFITEFAFHIVVAGLSFGFVVCFLVLVARRSARHVTRHSSTP